MNQLFPALVLVVFTGFTLAGSPVRAADYEEPPVLKASDLLPADLLKGEHHEIEAQVVNDGFMNHFTIRSDFGTFEAKSLALVEVRVREVHSLAELTPCSGDIEDARELLSGETTDVRELGELVFGSNTPATVWAAWQLVADGLHFTGTPDRVVAR